MDKVRLEVRETSRNSEKPKPKASKPPILSVKSEYRRGESSVTRNNFSEVLRLRAGNKTESRIYNDVSMGGFVGHVRTYSRIQSLYKEVFPKKDTGLGE